MNSHQRRKMIRKYFTFASNRIMQCEDGKGVFWCPHYLEATLEHDWSKHQGIDFNFLGIGDLKKKIFTGAIDTIIIAYINEVENKAYEELENKFPWPENLNLFETEKKNGSFVVTKRNDPYKGEDYQWVKERKKELYNSGDIQVFEKIRFDKSYSLNRIGLFAQLAKSYLVTQDMFDFIDTFRLNGQSEYVGVIPYSFTSEEIESWDGKTHTKINNKFDTVLLSKKLYV